MEQEGIAFIAFPRLQWLHEHSWLFRFTNSACLACLRALLILLLCVKCLPFLCHCSRWIGLILLQLCCCLNCWIHIRLKACVAFNIIYKPVFFLVSWSLKMVPIGCPETSVRNYQYSLCNSPEEPQFSSTSRRKPEIMVFFIFCVQMFCNINYFCFIVAAVRIMPLPSYFLSSYSLIISAFGWYSLYVVSIFLVFQLIFLVYSNLQLIIPILYLNTITANTQIAVILFLASTSDFSIILNLLVYVLFNLSFIYCCIPSLSSIRTYVYVFPVRALVLRC